MESSAHYIYNLFKWKILQLNKKNELFIADIASYCFRFLFQNNNKRWMFVIMAVKYR
jgi:hypothetical protein